MEERVYQIELKKENAVDKKEYRGGLRVLSRNIRCIRPLPLTETKTGLKKDFSQTRSGVIYSWCVCVCVCVCLCVCLPLLFLGMEVRYER